MMLLDFKIKMHSLLDEPDVHANIHMCGKQRVIVVLDGGMNNQNYWQPMMRYSRTGGGK